MTLRVDEIVTEVLDRSDLSEAEREDVMERLDSACASLAVASIRAGARQRDERLNELAESPGGSDSGESDCPREVGSKHARPGAEGLTAGAAWLQDWRLP